MTSLEKLVEEYFQQLFRTHASLKGKVVRRSDSRDDAPPNIIVIEAQQGEDLLEGPQGPNGEKRRKVEVTIRYRSATGKTPENDLTHEAVQECIRTAGARSTAIQNTRGFWLMILNEDMRGNRSHTKGSRQWELTVPCEAGMLY